METETFKQMSETARIAQLLEQTFEGKAYYGNSVLKTLEGVSAEIAAQKPKKSKNSIWEIVVHLILELRFHRRVIEGTAEKWIAGETTWNDDNDHSAQAWEKTIDALKEANRALVGAIRQLDDDILDQNAGQVSGSYYRMLNGVLQHSIFHSGQISILKTLVQRESE